MTEQIDQPQWEAFCDDFARKHHGFEARLEIIGREFGDQEMAAWLPFSGISYDPHHQQLFIMLGGVSSRYPVHLTHTIQQPQTIAVREMPEGGEDSAMLITTGDNTETLVSLRRQPQLTA
jgi:hypothetical protein